MDHHATDGGGMAPGTAGAGPGGAERAPGGPVAGNGSGAAVAGRVRADAAGAGSGRGGAGTAADRVWAVLLLNPDPVEWKELAEAAGVSRVAALEALLGFENAGYLLHIPAQRHGRFPHGDLWVLAGGLREQHRVTDAVRIGLLAKLSAEDGPGEAAWPGALDIGVTAPAVPIGPVTGLPVLPRRWLKELVAEQLMAVYPQALSMVGISQRLGGRSTGAIRIVADELVREGRVVCTDQAVKKYAALAPDGAPLESPGEHENIA
jgi:hypothetical protein